MNIPVISPQTWIISDTHFFHTKIGEYCDRPGDWQDRIIKNWHRLIDPGDDVLHLGDFALGKKENMLWLMKSLPGNLFLIQGNHDRLGVEFCKINEVSLIKAPVWLELDNKKLIFSHYPVFPLEPGWINLHGHIHNKTLDPPSLDHINMSVEVREYRPWQLKDILQAIQSH